MTTSHVDDKSINIIDRVNTSKFEPSFANLLMDPRTSDEPYRQRRYSRFSIASDQNCPIHVPVDGTTRKIAELDEGLLELDDFHALLEIFVTRARALLRTETTDHLSAIELGVHQIRIEIRGEYQGPLIADEIEQNTFDLVGIVCVQQRNIIENVIRLERVQEEFTLRLNEMLFFNNHALFHSAISMNTIAGRHGVLDLHVITALSLPPSARDSRHNSPSSVADKSKSEAERMPMLPTVSQFSDDGYLLFILVPESGNLIYAEKWQYEFAQYAHLFSTVADVSVLALPWPEAPSTMHRSAKTVYIASLALGYHTVVDRWLQWLRSWPNDRRLLNPVSLLEWNTRKTYLAELEAANVPVIPTMFIDHGPITPQMLRDAGDYFGEVNQLVVKPQVSADSDGTVRIELDDLSLPTIETTASMMIQPFLTSVCLEGELSVLVFGGQVSHAVRKRAAPNDFRVQETFGSTISTIAKPTEAMLHVVFAALAGCSQQPVYARVDMVRDDAGRLRLMELELIEPSLYFDHADDGGLAFVRAVLASE